VEGGDWCDWPGEREQFAELVAAAGRGETVLEVRSARALCALPDPLEEERLLGPLLLRGSGSCLALTPARARHRWRCKSSVR
jgi:hypothetical protein